MKRIVLATLAALLLVLGPAGVAQASLLATDWDIAGTFSNLYRVDVSTATATLIGSTGQVRMIGLVVDTDSTIYTISEEASSNLWTLDPTTGLATLVGTLGFNLQEGDMTISPMTGEMFVSDGRFGGDNLYKVDKTTGSPTLVGAFGMDGRDVSGLQFIGSTLYGLALRDAAADALVTVDPATGVATEVGLTGTNLGVIAAMGRDPDTGLTYIAGPLTGFGSDNQLYTIDLSTGAATLVGPLTGIALSVSGFSVAGEPAILRTIPEPSSLTLLGLGALGTLGVLRRRWKRAA